MRSNFLVENLTFFVVFSCVTWGYGSLIILGIWGRTIYFHGNECVSLLDEIGCRIVKQGDVAEKLQEKKAWCCCLLSSLNESRQLIESFISAYPFPNLFIKQAGMRNRCWREWVKAFHNWFNSDMSAKSRPERWLQYEEKRYLCSNPRLDIVWSVR